MSRPPFLFRSSPRARARRPLAGVATALVAILALTGPLAPSAAAETATIAFSDPSKPGTLRVSVSMGEVRIHGSDTKDIKVTSDLAEEQASRAPRPDGLRVIDGGEATFTLTEKNNVAELEYGTGGPGGHDNAEFRIEVPKNTSLVVQNSWGGEIRLESIDGDVEVKNLNGEITLRDLGGAALVETMNGEIEASFTRITTGKPLSFTSMNGEIKLRVPAEAAADLRLRTQNGSILTDFDEKTFVTKKSALTRADEKPEGKDLSSPTKTDPEDAADAATDAERTARDSAKAARRAAADASREAQQIAREAAREAAEIAREAVRVATEVSVDLNSHHVPKAPRPPRPPSIPSLAGGRVISGQLNGGGTAIQITTMNGDIIVRKRTD